MNAYHVVVIESGERKEFSVPAWDITEALEKVKREHLSAGAEIMSIVNTEL